MGGGYVVKILFEQHASIISASIDWRRAKLERRHHQAAIPRRRPCHAMDSPSKKTWYFITTTPDLSRREPMRPAYVAKMYSMAETYHMNSAHLQICWRSLTPILPPNPSERRYARSGLRLLLPRITNSKKHSSSQNFGPNKAGEDVEVSAAQWHLIAT